MADIITPFGATLNRTFLISNITLTASSALFSVRKIGGEEVVHKVITPTFSEELQKYSIPIELAHEEMELIPEGRYVYGLTIYDNAVIVDDEPTDGDPVLVVIPSASFVVEASVAREA